MQPRAALKQFNQPKAPQRIKIKEAFDERDKVRAVKIPKGETDCALELSFMTDAHIIAIENGIDPLTAVMCIRPLCENYEQIIMK